MRWMGISLVGLALLGCQEAPTFSRDVAPILEKHCLSCHVEGGIGPFPLQSYAQASERAFDIADETEEGDMPPFHADNSGACNTYQDAAVLTRQEKETLAAWAAAGAPEGEPNVFLPAPTLESLDTATDTLTMAQFEADGLVEDDLRCFLLDGLNLDTEKFLTAFEVIPENTKIVHHVILFRLDSQAGLEEALALSDPGAVFEDEDGQPFVDARAGYPCPGDSGIRDATMIAGWAPGRNVRRYPEGTGVPIPPGLPLVVQMHYNFAGFELEPEAALVSSIPGAVPYHGDGSEPAKGQTDQSRFALQLEDAVEQELLIFRIGNVNFSLPPGDPSVVVEREITIPEEAAAVLDRIELQAVTPHMHNRAASNRLSLSREEEQNVCVSRVPDWDYHWQDLYVFDEPVDILPGDTLRFECVFDTRGQTAPIGFGEGTGDEMCFNFLFLTCPALGRCPDQLLSLQ